MSGWRTLLGYGESSAEVQARAARMKEAEDSVIEEAQRLMDAVFPAEPEPVIGQPVREIIRLTLNELPEVEREDFHRKTTYRWTVSGVEVEVTAYHVYASPSAKLTMGAASYSATKDEATALGEACSRTRGADRAGAK